jgi:malate dehydrogenase (oxaloacetate-decarboxylating)(NADP+)
VVVQFEDFESKKAVPLLAKYRHVYRCFNDDIQGTGSVTLAGLLSAARNAGSSIRDLKIVCAGAGSAGLGVCSAIVDGMVAAGMERDDAMSRFVICTSQGAIGAKDGAHGDPNHARGLGEDRRPWLNPVVSDGASMLEAVQQSGANCLLGLSTTPGIFTEAVVKAALANHPAPIVMPMSNPTSKSECTPAQAYAWTDGAAVVATGSPFPPHKLPNGKVLIPSQCNNMYVFPGLGLAASVAGVTTVTDQMLYLAAVACSETMTEAEISEGRTFPNLDRIRDVSHAVACAVIEEALAEGLCTKINGDLTMDQISDLVSSKMYYPQYTPLVHQP